MSKNAIATIKPERRAVTSPANDSGSRALTATESREAARAVNEYQLDTVEIDTEPEPLAARGVLLAAAAFLIFAAVWTSVTQIDRVVSASGKIVSVVPTVVVQPFESAIIRTIEVQPGDVVKAGSTLATLDPTFAESDLGQLEARLAGFNTAIDRLEAERNKQDYKPDEDPYGYGVLQDAIWKERQTQLAAQLRLYEEREARSRASITSNRTEIENLTKRLQILKEIEDMRNSLERSEVGSRLNSLVARDNRIEIERSLARMVNTLAENQHELQSVAAERDVYLRQWDTKIVEDLVQKRNERDTTLEALAKAKRRKEMVALTTPIDAIVLEIAQRSVGSVINAGEAVFKLVPLDAPLEVEAEILAREIAFVKLGDEVEIKMEAFDFRQHGTLKGQVKVISSDSFATTRTGSPEKEPYYRARIEITGNDLHNLPRNERLIPGMPLNAEIKVGKRSVIAYFLKPITGGLNDSMREP
jgi:hemolysin D